MLPAPRVANPKSPARHRLADNIEGTILTEAGTNPVSDHTAFLRCGEITKRYGDVAANDGVDFSVRRKIHALLGENGAGKTTLMRILSGFTQPDNGEIRIDSQPVRIRGPQHAISLGIGMVHQHWRLVERFTVAENWRARLARDRRRLHRQIISISDRYGLKVRLDARVWELSLGERQRVEILRVLQRGARILSMNEPTAVLSPQETDQLFEALKEMVGEGKAIIFISHKMKEVMRHCDCITVMRRGRVVGERGGAIVTATELAELTIGRSLPAQPKAKSPGSSGADRIRIRQRLHVFRRRSPGAQGLQLSVHGGEILASPACRVTARRNWPTSARDCAARRLGPSG